MNRSLSQVYVVIGIVLFLITFSGLDRGANLNVLPLGLVFVSLALLRSQDTAGSGSRSRR